MFFDSSFDSCVADLYFRKALCLYCCFRFSVKFHSNNNFLSIESSVHGARDRIWNMFLSWKSIKSLVKKCVYVEVAQLHPSFERPLRFCFLHKFQVSLRFCACENDKIARGVKKTLETKRHKHTSPSDKKHRAQLIPCVAQQTSGMQLHGYPPPYPSAGVWTAAIEQNKLRDCPLGSYGGWPSHLQSGLVQPNSPLA